MMKLHSKDVVEYLALALRSAAGGGMTVKGSMSAGAGMGLPLSDAAAEMPLTPAVTPRSSGNSISQQKGGHGTPKIQCNFTITWRNQT